MHRLPETLTEQELLKLLRKVESKKHRLAYALGFYACLRVSEVVKLRPENVDKQQQLLRVKDAKGGVDRNIPIPPQVARALGNLPVGTGARNLQICFKLAAKNFLGRNLRFHSLRHSGASYYINERHWSTREVQRLLGHSKITTTEIYTHVSPQDLVKRMWDQ